MRIRTSLLLAALGLLLGAVPAWAQPGAPFTRGQWTRSAGSSGNTTFVSSVWVGDGVAQSLNGGIVTPGQNFGDFRGNKAGSVNTFFAEFQAPMGWDSLRRRMVIGPTPGGGGWTLFEVEEFDFATGTWNPDGRPQNPYTRLVRMGVPTYQTGEFIGSPACPAGLLDPNNFYPTLAKVDHTAGVRIFPNATHTTQSGIFMPTVGRFLYLPSFGGDWTDQCAQAYFFEWDTIAKQWESLSQDTASGLISGEDWQTSSGTWAPSLGKAILYNGYRLYTYNPTAAYGSRTTMLIDFTTLPSGGAGTSNGFGTMLWDSKRNRAVYIGNVKAALTYNYTFYVDGFTTTPTVHAMTLSGALTNASIGDIPGFVYDPIADRYVIWMGGKTIYFVDPTTFVVTSVTPSGGLDPGTRVWGSAGNSGFGNGFAYDATTDTFLGIGTSTTNNGANEAGVVVFAPTRPPVLAFTDIISGPKTGNSDTSKGQTANVNGAIVTIWGANLVGATFSINNAAPAATYYVGNATPPACGPANLYNGYQKLQCAILQVASTATSGAGTIVATAGGYTSNTLPFLVQTGTISFVAPSGLQTALDAMAVKDIVYVTAGTSGGVSIPTVTSGVPGNPIAIVAYPGATVQIGSATVGGFQLTHSDTGHNVVYSKFIVYGTSSDQAITMADDARVVGNWFSAPNATAQAGTVGTSPTISSNNLSVYGNEFTVCGIDPTDAQYHVLYLGGNRGQGAAGVNTGRYIGWNYFHDNNAVRALNFFNTSSNGGQDVTWAITTHVIHDNVVVNQNGDGLLLGQGVVGENWVYNNLFIRSGNGAAVGGGGINLRMSDPFLSNGTPSPSGLPILVHIFNNSLLSVGTGSGSGIGVLEMTYTPNPTATLDMHNNIFNQANGVAYITPTTTSTPGAGQSTKNLWIGAGGAPAFDGTPISADPQFVSAVIPYNLHLQASSPALGVGVNMTSGAVGLRDLDWLTRPNAAWDLGAYQGVGSAVVSIPVTPTPLKIGAGTTLKVGAGTTLKIGAQ